VYGKINTRTKVLILITPAFAFLVSDALRTMLEWFMAVSNVVEEMYLLFSSKQSSTDAVHGSVSPTLYCIRGQERGCN